ncbi:MAG: multiheme c-type cytochrome [Isosphaeraceae bacterium]
MSRRSQAMPSTPRHPLRATVAVGLVVIGVAYVGCSNPNPGDPPKPAGSPPTPSKSAPVETKTDPSSTASATPRPEPKAPFAGWPTPEAALVITGEQLGYLEPCGCTQGQLGGLIRRYELVRQLTEEKKWPVAGIDLGSLVKEPASARGGLEQSKIKFNIALRALATLKYDALALSAEDLKVGVDEAVGQYLNLPGGKLRIVAANVTVPGLETKVVPSVTMKVGKVTIGVTAVVDPESIKALRDPSLDLIQVKSVESSLPGVLDTLKKDTQVQVLLVQAKPEEARKLAETYPDFEVVVGTSLLADPEDQPVSLNGGKTLLVTVGQKGKHVGVLGLYPDTQEPFRYQRVTLDPKLDAKSSAMKTLIQDEFRETLKQQKLVEGFPRHDFVSASGDSAGATFVGVDACKECHPATVEAWAESKHAHAFDSLLHDPKPNVIHDVECISCHTVGFGYTSGYLSAEQTPLLKNVQCENCHGPGSKHVAEPTVLKHQVPLRVTLEQAEKNRLCLSCHDEDNSPHFDFTKYWDQIEHGGLDNPKEHVKAREARAKAAGKSAR